MNKNTKEIYKSIGSIFLSVLLKVNRILMIASSVTGIGQCLSLQCPKYTYFIKYVDCVRDCSAFDIFIYDGKYKWI